MCWLPEEKWGVGVAGVEGGLMVMEDGLILGGGNTVKCTDILSEKYTLKTYMILLTNVNPINLI